MEQKSSTLLSTKELLRYNAKKIIYKRALFFFFTFIFTGYTLGFITVTPYYQLIALTACGFLFVALFELFNALLFPLDFYEYYNDIFYKKRTKMPLIKPLCIIFMSVSLIALAVLVFFFIGNPLRSALALTIAPVFLATLLLIPVVFFLILYFYIKLYHQISAGHATVDLYYANPKDSLFVSNSDDSADQLLVSDLKNAVNKYFTPTENPMPFIKTNNFSKRLFFAILCFIILTIITYTVFQALFQ